MDLGISGKRALVLAAGGGLGSAIAAALVTEGVDVFLTDWYKAALDQVKVDLTSLAPVRVEAHPCNLAKADEIEVLCDAALESFGGIDILVNITGGPPSGSLTVVDDETWHKEFDAMVLSIFRVTRRLLPGMRERKWGRILTCTSSGIIEPIANLGISNALRTTLAPWSKTLATEVASEGVTVNVLAPGRIHTKRIDELDRAAAKRQGKAVEDVVRQSLVGIPAARYGRPDEFASVATFLVSERASYVTGSTIRVDGGLIKSL